MVSLQTLDGQDWDAPAQQGEGYDWDENEEGNNEGKYIVGAL